MFSAIGRAIVNRYVGTFLLVVLGIAIGALAFLYVWPGKPKIGIIDIPFTIITDDSAYVIGEFLDYARRAPNIKAVVIRLNSPGGGAAASEQLYLQTRKLREKKPVVVVMNDIVASGGYMMGMGASHIYAKPSSFVGNVGVILFFPGLFIPNPPPEQIMPTGPSKLNGGGRRYFVGVTDQLKQGFAHIVLSERGSRLKMSTDELLEGKIYSGIESARTGLVDEVGGDADAYDKAAEMAGISNYGVVDVNAEVFRAFNQRFKRIIEPLQDGASEDTVPPVMAGWLRQAQDPAAGEFGATPRIDMMRRYLMPSGMGAEQERALPGFPLKVNGPNIYYLYVGPDQPDWGSDR